MLVFGPGVADVVRKREELPASSFVSKPIALGSVERFADLAELAAVQPETAPEVEVLETDDAAILYTSGTTGRPKGALFDHHRLLWVGINAALCTGLRDGDRFLHVAPMYHAADLTMMVVGGTQVGGTSVALT